jgi:hypothetical protein
MDKNENAYFQKIKGYENSNNKAAGTDVRNDDSAMGLLTAGE